MTKKSIIGLISGILCGILVLLAGCTIHIDTGPSKSPSIALPSVVPSPPKSAQQIANEFPGCTWKNESEYISGTELEILDSQDCESIIEYSGIPGFADDLKTDVLAKYPSAKGWYFVNGNTWAAVVLNMTDAVNISDYFGVTYEELQ